MTLNLRWERLAGIYQHAFEPSMPPSNFFGLRHGTSPRSHTKCAADAKVPKELPGNHIQKYKWGRRGTTAAPNKRRQLRGNGGADDVNAFNASSMTTFPVLSPQDGQQNSFLRLKAVYFGHVYQGNFPLPAPPPWPLAPDAA